MGHRVGGRITSALRYIIGLRSDDRVISDLGGYAQWTQKYVERTYGVDIRRI